MQRMAARMTATRMAAGASSLRRGPRTVSNFCSRRTMRQIRAAGAIAGRSAPSGRTATMPPSDFSQATQEFRMVSTPNETLDWTLGTFFLGSEDDRYEYTGFNFAMPANTFYPGQPALPAGYEEGTHSSLQGWSAAVFGDATWHVTDRFDVLAGARFSYDHREIDYVHASNVAGVTLGAPGQSQVQSMGSSDISPKIGLAYEIAPKVRTYATIARGYKAGGYNISFAPSSDLSYAAETAWNYEAGVKASLFDGKLDLAASLFYFDWKNQQIYSFNGYSVWIANAPKSRNYGAEFEITARPFQGLELFAGLGLLDARFTDAPASQTGGNADGNWQPLASRYSLSLSAQYTAPLTAQLNGVARVDWNWRSAFYFDVDNTIEQDAYGIVNARLGVEAKNWSLYLVALNLFDQDYYVVATDNGYGHRRARRCAQYRGLCGEPPGQWLGCGGPARAAAGSAPDGLAGGRFGLSRGSDGARSVPLPGGCGP
ncbi:MAG: hypothetical protein B7Z30_08005 [Rhizobiales bacterium 12-68-15]|nr:MAG: hypothetical protein B7Z30_08005 [Rhizobiales bacterium 12-68-15]